MKTTKKALLALVCAAALVFGSVFATYAYLTDSKSVTNTFSVGKVTITLDETDVDVYGVKDGETRVTENAYKLIPGHEYTKDPTVHVTAGSEQCYVFVKVVDEIVAIEDATTIAEQMKTNGWVALTGETNVYYYNGGSNAGVVDAREAKADLPVFANFKIKTDADVSTYNGKTVTVTAYAVQADGFDTAADAWAAAPAEWNK